MEKGLSQTDPNVLQFAEKLFQPEDAILGEVRHRAEKKGLAAIHVGKMDGLHLEVLTRAIGATKAVEIGTLAGYSGICIARGLPSYGKLYTFEAAEHHAEVAAESFKRAGVEGMVRIFRGPALENLPKIEKEGPFDLVFIDADKVNYPNYLDWAARNLRVGGTVIGDNTFAFGMLADQRFDDAEDERAVTALRRFNETVARSGRFRATILPTAEGLTVAVKIR